MRTRVLWSAPNSIIIAGPRRRARRSKRSKALERKRRVGRSTKCILNKYDLLCLTSGEKGWGKQSGRGIQSQVCRALHGSWLRSTAANSTQGTHGFLCAPFRTLPGAGRGERPDPGDGLWQPPPERLGPSTGSAERGASAGD